MLGKTKALADKPYQAYGGPLTAGASGLQNQAFGGYGALDPNQQTGIGSFGFGAGPGSFGFGSAAGQGYAPGFTAGSADLSGMQAGSFYPFAGFDFLLHWFYCNQRVFRY